MIRLRVYAGVLALVILGSLVALLDGMNPWGILPLALLWAGSLCLALKVGGREAGRWLPQAPPIMPCPHAENAPCGMVRTWLGAAGELLLIVQPSNNRIYFVGPDFMQAFGYTQGDLLKHSWTEFIHPEDRAMTEEAIRNAPLMRPVVIANRWRNRSNKAVPWVWLEWSLLSIPSLALVYAKAKNLSARFEHESQMATWSRVTGDLLSVSNAAVPVSVRKFDWVNEAWVQQLGWSYQELYSRPIVSFLHPMEEQEIIQTRTQQERLALTSEGHVNDLVRCKVQCEDGRYKCYEWSSIQDEGRLYASGRGIDEEEAQKAELRKAITDLKSRNADLERFASVAAHQLRSPPRTIAGLAQALLEDYGPHLNEEGLQDLRDIRADADTMAEVVDGLYLFSKVRTGEELTLVPIDLGEVLREVWGTLAKQGVVQSQDQLQEQDLPRILGDRVLLMEVFRNLIENGLKFNESTPKVIQVSATPLGSGRWSITVTDNGIGIAPKYQGKVFQMFQRMHPQYKGTGVGLALVQAIVLKLGGTITLQSAPGKGASFTFDLEGVR